MRAYMTLVVLALAASLSEPAMAQQPDGTAGAKLAEAEPAPLDCTMTTSQICKDDSCAKSETFGSLKLPSRLLVHFDRRVIASTSEDGLPHVSSINSFATSEDGVVLQGVDGSTGWMIHLSRKDPDISFAVASHHTVMTAFGTCKAID
jgi:hypothetical protein